MKKSLLALGLLLGISALQAQERPVFTPQEGALLDGKTIVKTNLMGYAFKSYSLSVERIITKRISLQAGFSRMPDAKLGFGLDQLASELKDTKVGSTSYSLDFRFYLSRRGYGHGFYLQPYFRHESHSLSDFRLDYKTSTLATNLNESHPYTIGGSIKSNSFGLAIGAQWLFGKKKNFLIDWTIIGAHFSGNAKTNLNGVLDANASITNQEVEQYKKDIENFVEDTKILKSKDLTFDIKDGGREISTKLNKHPYFFVRASLSLGFRF